MLVSIDNTTSRHLRGCFPLLSSGLRIHYIGANNNSAVRTQVKVKREANVVQRIGMTTQHNAKIKLDSKHDSDSEANSDSNTSSTKLKLRRILAKTTGRKSRTNKLQRTKVSMSSSKTRSSSKTNPRRRSTTRKEVDDEDTDVRFRSTKLKLQKMLGGRMLMIPKLIQIPLPAQQS